MNTTVAQGLSRSQQAVLTHITESCSLGYSFNELQTETALKQFSPSRIRTAVKELVDSGLVKSSGRTTLSPFGRNETIWVAA